MVRLLSMLMKDPLGYANTKEYRNFMQEEEDFDEHSMWGKEVLRYVRRASLGAKLSI